MPLSFSNHARHRMKTRHLSLELINDTIHTGTVVKDHTRQRVRYETDQLVVVLVSPTVRNVVTVWSKMITRQQENDLDNWKHITRRLRTQIKCEIRKRARVKMRIIYQQIVRQTRDIKCHQCNRKFRKPRHLEQHFKMFHT